MNPALIFNTTHLPPATAWRVQALLRARSAEPFLWGRRDCAMLPFDVAQIVTGKDPAADLRGVYQTARSALRLLRAMGGFQGMASARFGKQICPPEARDGDVLLLKGDDAECRLFGGALGVRWRGLSVAQGEKGLVVAKPSDVCACWMVT